MDEAKFWEIIAQSRSGFDPSRQDGNMDRQLESLRALLTALPPAEIHGFDRIFHERMNEAYCWPLWGAAYVIGGGCSDDGFTDFRSWLISMGREAYTAALKDPESLVDLADAPGVEDSAFEEFQYVAREVYENKTGEDMPDTGVSHPAEPAGEPWEEDGDDLERLFPVLWAKYGE